MGFTRNRIYFGLIFYVFLFCPLFGDQTDFYAKTYELIDSLQEFSQDCFLKELVEFERKKTLILSDLSLRERIASCPSNSKLVFYDGNHDVYIKKRYNNNLNEVYTWELSLLLNGADFVVPSFPIFINNKEVVIQPTRNFVTGSWVVIPPHSAIVKVNLEDYWKYHLIAYLLGMSDLSGMNIGITKEGKPLHFDNECSFFDSKDPYLHSYYFYVPYVSVAFDWPQYTEPLDAATASNLQGFLESLCLAEEKIKIYFKIRNLSFSSLGEPIIRRLEEVKNFYFQEGTTFRHFIEYIYPRMSLGLDELSEIVGKTLGRKVGHGIALFFATRMIRLTGIDDKGKEDLSLWIENYIR